MTRATRFNKKKNQCKKIQPQKIQCKKIQPQKIQCKKNQTQHPGHQGEAIDPCLNSANVQPITLRSIGHVTPTQIVKQTGRPWPQTQVMVPRRVCLLYLLFVLNI